MIPCDCRIIDEPGNFGETRYFTSTLMMEAGYSSETLIPTYSNKGCNKPADHSVSYLEI